MLATLGERGGGRREQRGLTSCVKTLSFPARFNLDLRIDSKKWGLPVTAYLVVATSDPKTDSPRSHGVHGEKRITWSKVRACAANARDFTTEPQSSPFDRLRAGKANNHRVPQVCTVKASRVRTIFPSLAFFQREKDFFEISLTSLATRAGNTFQSRSASLDRLRWLMAWQEVINAPRLGRSNQCPVM